MAFNEQDKLFPNFHDSPGRCDPDVVGIYAMNFTGMVAPHSISWWFDVVIKLANDLELCGVEGYN
jgi:hypothetical protein